MSSTTPGQIVRRSNPATRSSAGTQSSGMGGDSVAVGALPVASFG